jgi:hypothetical protein
LWHLKQVQFVVKRNESTYLEIENVVYLKTDWLQQLTDKLVSQSVTFGVNNFPEKNKKNNF